MPPASSFDHQSYQAREAADFELIQAGEAVAEGSEPFNATLRLAGDTLRAADVRAIYLLHGTFVGNDALGLIRKVGRVWPEQAAWLKQLAKQTTDLEHVKALRKLVAEFEASYLGK